MLPSVKKSGSLMPSFFQNFWNEDLFNNLWGGKVPAVNVIENKKEYRLEVAAPGLEKNDFKLKVENNVLEISAEKETKSEEKDEKFLRQEFSHASFFRSFTLPQNVDTTKIDASQKDGILKIILPKKSGAEEKTTKEIPIK